MVKENSIIPNEILSNRERVTRKAESFGNDPFTLRDINKLLKPRMKLDSIRFQIENLVNNLLVEKLPRVGREPQLYVMRDVLKDIEKDTPLSGRAHDYLTELYSIAEHLLQGHAIPLAQLREERLLLGNTIEVLKEEVQDLSKLHDCLDLWNPETLVKRLGFKDDE